MNNFEESYLKTKEQLEHRLDVLSEAFLKLYADDLPEEASYEVNAYGIVIRCKDYDNFKKVLRYFSERFGSDKIGKLQIYHSYGDIVTISKPLKVIEDFSAIIMIDMDYHDVPQSLLPDKKCAFKEITTSYRNVVLECPNE
jgi:hypothetical protein